MEHPDKCKPCNWIGTGHPGPGCSLTQVAEHAQMLSTCLITCGWSALQQYLDSTEPQNGSAVPQSAVKH